MRQLIIDENRQITLDDEMLEHLGVKPGDHINICLMSERRMELTSNIPNGIANFIGALTPKDGVHLTIEEINQITGPCSDK